MLNVVILNGGRGAAAVIPALLNRQGLRVTSVVNAYDDGKSTGEIRRFFGMLGPSDIRKVQELMLPPDDPDYQSNLKIFQYRFPVSSARAEVLEHLRSFADGTSSELVGVRFGSVKVRSALQEFVAEFLTALHAIEQVNDDQFSFEDCSLMNCIYAGAFLVFNRNIEQATMFIDRLFKLRGTVLPTSIEDKKLVALRENGEMLYSEAEIVELRSNVRIDRIYLVERILDKARFDALSLEEKRYYLERHHCYVAVSPGVQSALEQAHIIIYSAGTQHSSLYPTYLSTGLAEAIADNRGALKVFVTNIGADYETPMYKASDYIKGAYRYLSFSCRRTFKMQELFNVCFVNKHQSEPDESYVELDSEGFRDLPVRTIIDNFESPRNRGKHDGVKVVSKILEIYSESTVLK